MAQAHLLHPTGNGQRLERIVESRLARLHVAEAAAARAGVAEDHEGGGAAVPALADVRAGRLLADGVELVAVDQALELHEARAARRADLEPRRLALAVRADLAHLEDACAARIGARARAHAGTASRSATVSSR